MTEKPKKKQGIKYFSHKQPPASPTDMRKLGYNSACDDHDAWLKEKKEKIEEVIDMWIYDNNLGNYDKIPKIKEYDKLASAIREHLK